MFDPVTCSAQDMKNLQISRPCFMVIHKSINSAQNLKLMFPAQTNSPLY